MLRSIYQTLARLREAKKKYTYICKKNEEYELLILFLNINLDNASLVILILEKSIKVHTSILNQY